MRKSVLTKSWLVATTAWGVSLPAFAQQRATTTSVITTPANNIPKLSWAEQTLSQLKMEFGTVPKHAEVVKSVTVTNPFKEDVQITDAHTSCGCFKATVGQKVLKTNESTTISVSMNTHDFQGERNAKMSVTMTFNGSNYKSVEIPLHGFIRTDFEISPSSLNIPSVEQGRSATKTVTLRTMRPGTQVTSVRASNPLVKTEVREVMNGGSKVFEIVVTLDKSAPLGKIRDMLAIKTNDTSMSELQVEFSANVEPDLVVTPQTISLGNMRPGVDVTKVVTIRGQRAFSIEKLERDTELDCWKCKFSKEQKSLHMVTLTMKPPETPGDYVEEFTISIPGRPEPVKIKAVGTIISTTPASPSPATSQANNAK
jgi:hypothetical protein